MTRFALVASLLIVLAACSTSSDDSKTDTGPTNQDVAASQDMTAEEDTMAAEDLVTPEDVQSSADVPATADVATLLAFGETCVDNEDCESGTCHTFGELGPTCTVTCESPDDCPEGAEGQKCNNKGVCKP